MNCRFASARVLLGALLLTAVGAAFAAAPKAPAVLAGGLAQPDSVEQAAPRTLTVADLAKGAEANDRRFKSLMNLAGYDPGGIYCRKLEARCNNGDQWACDRYELVCSG